MRPLVIIIGPTAVGKSALGVELALSLNGEIISGDSVQVYRKLDIGSAKPTKEEQKGIPHHLLDFLDPTEPYTVALFQEQASKLIESIRDREKTPIIVGGTGLYIRSITDGFDFPEKGSDSLKQKWLDYASYHGNVELHKQLAQRDPISASKLHINDTARIVRALEVFDLTGEPLSIQRKYNEKEYSELDKSIVYIGLTAPREFIYERINRRCEIMLASGLLEETRSLLQQGYPPKLKSLQSIGYRHAVYHLTGKVTQQEMLRLMQRDTRHFAKRQLTWFKRDTRIKWYDITIHPIDWIVKDIAHTCREIQTRVE